MTASVHNLEWLELAPHAEPAEAEYKRLLGFPAAYPLEGRARELAEWARAWYAQHGRPWIFAHGAKSLEFIDDVLCVEHVPFASRRLREQLTEAQAQHAVLVGVSAGPECEAHARRLWQEEKPDEYFFLEIYGSAVVEHLVTLAGARLCAWADARGLAALPHYSPGYSGWEISDQVKLLSLLRRAPQFPARLEAMETGMLRPKKSLLALFGLTDRLDLARSLAGLIPCENCSFTPCQFRRAPFQRSVPQLEDVGRLQPLVDAALNGAGLARQAKYSVNPKALRKWAEQRLELKFAPDGSVEALFRYEGTTCSNMGRPLQYDYRIKLGSPRHGYPILHADCAAAPGDTGHSFQCEFINHPGALATSVAAEKPLLNQPLNDVLSWPRAYSPAGCYCESSSRAHKWGLVYEVIHFALVERESKLSK
ncbi:MAG TPA: hypothetical protein VHB20_16775 [Verrucomicrobiae bacterium]|jgi:hypothetical protein|nr:hypothetical protein [Verrucomicrobiae bacterium]